MALSLLAPAVLAAAAAAAAIAFAPAAAADRDNDSKPGPRGTSQQQDAWNDAPKGWTNEAQWARPGASNPFGPLPKPPVFGMDRSPGDPAAGHKESAGRR
jgi:hypothetical protein